MTAKGGESHVMDGPRGLLAGILLRALGDVRNGNGHAKDASEWIGSDSENHLFTFRRICEELDLSPVSVRNTLPPVEGYPKSFLFTSREEVENNPSTKKGGAQMGSAKGKKGKGKGTPAKAATTEKKMRKPGVCAFIAERLQAGDETEKILDAIHEKFPASKATRKDVSIIRCKIGKAA